MLRKDEHQSYANFLAVDAQVPEVAAITQRGRDVYRAWVERFFAPLLADVDPRQRRRRVATFVVISDLPTWKVLRLEQGLTCREYVDTVRERWRPSHEDPRLYQPRPGPPVPGGANPR